MRNWVYALSLVLCGCVARTREVAPEVVTLGEMGQLPGFRLTSHNGGAFTSSELRNRIWVLDFIFTNCQGACPRMSAEMRKVQEAYADDPSVVLISISVDPERDTAERLREYALRYKARAGKWFFLTGNKERILALQRAAAVDMDPEQVEQSHNKCFTLVDRDGYVRGVYRSDRAEETDQLIRDIRLLKRNPERPRALEMAPDEQ